MKKILSVLVLSLFVASASFASFPVKNSSNDNSAETTNKKGKKQSVSAVKEKSEVAKVTGNAEVKSPKKIEKEKSAKKEARGDNSTVAIILALISVLILPLGLHNWYLGRKKQALWQLLLVIPFGILILPAIASWIWQVVDLIRLLVNGSLPQ